MEATTNTGIFPLYAFYLKEMSQHPFTSSDQYFHPVLLQHPPHVIKQPANYSHQSLMEPSLRNSEILQQGNMTPNCLLPPWIPSTIQCPCIPSCHNAIQWNDLRDHLSRHSNYFPVHCSICKSFNCTSMADFKRHQLLLHRDNTECLAIQQMIASQELKLDLQVKQVLKVLYRQFCTAHKDSSWSQLPMPSSSIHSHKQPPPYVDVPTQQSSNSTVITSTQPALKSDVDSHSRSYHPTDLAGCNKEQLYHKLVDQIVINKNLETEQNAVLAPVSPNLLNLSDLEALAREAGMKIPSPRLCKSSHKEITVSYREIEVIEEVKETSRSAQDLCVEPPLKKSKNATLCKETAGKVQYAIGKNGKKRYFGGAAASQIPSEEKQHCCQHCQKRYRSKQGLNYHFVNVHTKSSDIQNHNRLTAARLNAPLLTLDPMHAVTDPNQVRVDTSSIQDLNQCSVMEMLENGLVPCDSILGNISSTCISNLEQQSSSHASTPTPQIEPGSRETLSVHLDKIPDSVRSVIEGIHRDYRCNVYGTQRHRNGNQIKDSQGSRTETGLSSKKLKQSSSKINRASHQSQEVNRLLSIALLNAESSSIEPLPVLSATDHENQRGFSAVHLDESLLNEVSDHESPNCCSNTLDSTLPCQCGISVNAMTPSTAAATPDYGKGSSLFLNTNNEELYVVKPSLQGTANFCTSTVTEHSDQSRTFNKINEKVTKAAAIHSKDVMGTPDLIDLTDDSFTNDEPEIFQSGISLSGLCFNSETARDHEELKADLKISGPDVVKKLKSIISAPAKLKMRTTVARKEKDICNSCSSDLACTSAAVNMGNTSIMPKNVSQPCIVLERINCDSITSCSSKILNNDLSGSQQLAITPTSVTQKSQGAPLYGSSTIESYLEGLLGFLSNKSYKLFSEDNFRLSEAEFTRWANGKPAIKYRNKGIGSAATQDEV